MPGLWLTRADDLKHRCPIPRGVGSASEAYCPARPGLGGLNECLLLVADAAFINNKKMNRPIEATFDAVMRGRLSQFRRYAAPPDGTASHYFSRVNLYQRMVPTEIGAVALVTSGLSGS
jgi:hypothetical protein